MKNKKKKAWEFPNISRFFTESSGKLAWEKKKNFIYIFTVIFLLFIMFMLFDLKQKLIISNGLVAQRAQVLTDIKSWEKVLSERKDYRDGYLQLAILQSQIGDINGAKKNLNEALKIDPNSKEGRELEIFLQRY
jgi:hypothetical protein